ncbi:ATP synthase F0 subcomplex subunit H atp14 [Elasticomyces elasticus]|nr:ATP synthase F0 subcomplex subunit H atp14 [Elasticomyces elasticus]
MIAHSLRASVGITAPRQSIARVARQQNVVTFRRTLITPTAVRQADLVQDMYLRELKSYKPPPVKASDAEGHVQKFNPPKPPPSPEESDIAKDLQAYETQAVEVEGQSSEDGAAPVNDDWFVEEEDEPETPHH